jgi:hypothetical protein
MHTYKKGIFINTWGVNLSKEKGKEKSGISIHIAVFLSSIGIILYNPRIFKYMQIQQMSRLKVSMDPP